MRHSVGSSEVSRDSPSSSNEEEGMTRALPLRLLARDGVAAAALPEAPLRVEGMVTKREAKRNSPQDDAESVADGAVDNMRGRNDLETRNNQGRDDRLFVAPL